MAIERVIEHHHETPSGSGGMGFLMGIILLIVFLFLFFYYLLPALRGATTAPQINLPGKIDVNVNQGK